MSYPVRNIVLVVIDALRRDRVGTYSDSPLTPTINDIASEGETFDSAFSCSNVTDSSLTTIMTGQYPTRHGILNHGSYVSKKEYEHVSATRTLAELLRSTYSTVAVNRKNRWHRRGFDCYLNPEEPMSQDSEYLLSYPQADSVTDKGIKGLSEVENQWFLNLHYWDTHIPYRPLINPPDKVQERTYKDKDRPLDELIEPIADSKWGQSLRNFIGDSNTVGEMKRKYDTGVWYADKELGRLVEHLKSCGQYDNTAFIITADHGESLTEHGILFDHHGLYDITTHVPFVVKAPGFDGRESRFVQHFDVVPTVLDLLDVNYNPDWFDGTSLVPESGSERKLNRDAVYMESAHKARKRSIRTNKYKYIKRIGDRSDCRYCEVAHASNEELYDLSRDRNELENVIRDHQKAATELEERLNGWIEAVPEPTKDQINFAIPEQHMEDLGYL